MTEIERGVIQRQAAHLQLTFGVFPTLALDGRRLSASVQEQISEHLRIVAIHSKKQWSQTTVTALLFFGIELPTGEKETAKPDAIGSTATGM